ncbi:hypothetical protein [Altererythrobacter sp. MF3-039]|uniref:hypothetical protein n=1 Tax=Altererythrobacter sp. MF3-039 TaxID=3252901 RepID=UPI00390CA63A
MTVRIAAARTAATSPLARHLVKGEARHADNDLPRGSAETINAITTSALRHFAEYGLRAASEARARAESALAKGDGSQFEHWLGICRALDREQATELAKVAQR